MPTLIASFEVDQRQRLILQADKLREMLGASRLIEETVEIAEAELSAFPDVRLVTPVSGVLRFVSDDQTHLAEFLWLLRERIVEEMHLPSTITMLPGVDGSFKASVDNLEERVRKKKDAKTGAGARPSSPLFAQCMIQPQLSANIWRPRLFRSPDDARRGLISDESKLREEESDSTYSQQFQKFAALQNFRGKHKKHVWEGLPKEFSHLAPGEQDSYLAFIKADGDGMGRLLMNLEWDKLSTGMEGSKACLAFTRELERCLEEATTNAVNKVTRDWEYGAHNRFPVAPLVRAGEDYWIVCRREKGFSVAVELDRAYRELVGRSEPITSARKTVPGPVDEPLSLSFGILFVKQGYPFEAQLHMAESLIKNAKRFRRGLTAKQGCLDYYWMESSAREDVIGHREETQTIVDDGGRFRLYTTPWTMAETEAFLEAAEILSGTELASRKLRQLETILRLGTEFAELAYEQWRLKLDGEERGKLDEAVAKIPARFGLQGKVFAAVAEGSRVSWSPLLDLLRLVEIQRRRIGEG